MNRMVKKIGFFLCLGLMVGQHASAQVQKGDVEFSLGYGALSAPKVENLATSILGEVITLGTQYQTDKVTYGPVSFTGQYALTNRLKVGMALSFERESSELWTQSFNKNNQSKLGDINIDNYGVMASGSFVYVRRKYFELHSELALGVGFRRECFDKQSGSSLSNESSTSSRFAYQITPIGVRLGGKLAGFAEVGFGYKGFVLAGISYRL